MIEVVVTDEFHHWYDGLEERETDAVNLAVERLVLFGVALRSPYSSAIRGSRYALRELRVQSGGRRLRVFYAFDPLRQAVLLLGADKGSEKQALFYKRMISECETLWELYLEEVSS